KANVRTFAASGLGYADDIQDAGARAGEVLARAFDDQDPGVRMFACQAMQFRQAKAQAPAIQRLLNDEKKDVRAMAVCTLGRLGCKEAAPALLEVLRTEGDDKEMRYHLVVALAQVGEAQNALRLAKQCLAEEDWSQRWSAVAAVKALDFP